MQEAEWKEIEALSDFARISLVLPMLSTDADFSFAKVSMYASPECVGSRVLFRCQNDHDWNLHLLKLGKSSIPFPLVPSNFEHFC